LVATGRRVLLVSATNIAVDNALLGVIRSRPFKPGSLLRVGLPHHPDVLEYPDVCLPDLVRKQLADVDRQRQAIESRLLEMRQADEELARLQEEITGFDAVQYRQALQLVTAEAAIPDLAQAAAQASAALQIASNPALRSPAETRGDRFASISRRMAPRSLTGKYWQLSGRKRSGSA